MSRDRDHHRQRELERRLRSLRAPDEDGARARGLDVVRDAYAAGERIRPARAGRRAGFGAAALAALLTGLIALTPAGASVREWISDTVGVDRERRALTSLPAEGAILTVTGEDAWVAREDGTRRRLGSFDEATFSPRGLHVAAAAGRRLTALTPDGDVRWTLSASGRIADPAWAPSGFRIAYRAASGLRVVAGDGSGDRSLAAAVAPVPPQWRPPVGDRVPSRNVLAYVDRRDRIRVRDIDRPGPGRLLASRHEPSSLLWLADGRLAVVGGGAIEVLDRDGSHALEIPVDGEVTGIAASPDGERLALITRRSDESGPRSELVLQRLEPGAVRGRSLLQLPGALRGVAFSPDGSWLALGSPAADSWFFVQPLPSRKLVERVEAVSPISPEFDPSANGAGFPRILEWRLLES